MKFPSRPISASPEVNREFQRLSEWSTSIHDLDVLQVLPDKPRNGMLRYFAADVVSPSSAEGFWAYEAGSWVKK